MVERCAVRCPEHLANTRGRYQVILADPPWHFRDQGTRASPAYKGRQRWHPHYTTLTEEQICSMGSWVPELATGPSILFLWAPHALVLDGTALRVAHAWGYVPKQEIVWRKMTLDNKRVRLGVGHYTRVCTEPMLLCVQPRASRLIKRHDVPNTFDAPRGLHSAKPDRSYEIVESLVDGPYLELFARRRYSARWDVWGNEVEWSAAA